MNYQSDHYAIFLCQKRKQNVLYSLGFKVILTLSALIRSIIQPHNAQVFEYICDSSRFAHTMPLNMKCQNSERCYVGACVSLSFVFVRSSYSFIVCKVSIFQPVDNLSEL